MPNHFLCPHCQTPLRTQSNLAQFEIDCPKCTRTIYFPIPKDEALPPIRIEIPEAKEVPLNPAVVQEVKPLEQLVVQRETPSNPFEFHEMDSEDDLNESENSESRPQSRPVRSEPISFASVIKLLYGLGALQLGLFAILVENKLSSDAIIDADHALVRQKKAWLMVSLFILIGTLNVISAYGLWHRKFWGLRLGLILTAWDGIWTVGSIYWDFPCIPFVPGVCFTFSAALLLNPQNHQEFRSFEQ